MIDSIIKTLVQKLKIETKYITNVLNLLADNNTIAFIARYRKHLTNNMDEFQIQAIAHEYEYLTKLNKRKEVIIKNLEQKGLLTNDLLELINNCQRLVDLENLYEPYASNKKTKASIAIEKGLEPLALLILKNNPNSNIKEVAKQYLNEQVLSVDEAIAGACDIIAQKVANDTTLREILYETINKHAKLITRINKITNDPTKNFALYYEFSCPIKYLKAYQLMAIDRANELKIIAFKLDFKKEFLIDFAINKYTRKIKSNSYDYIKSAVNDGFDRLLIPSVSNAVYKEKLEEAHQQSAQIFSNNLQQLLLQKPLKGHVVLGFDPGYVHGCKLAIVNKNNQLLHTDIIYPHKPQILITQAKNTLISLINKYEVNTIAIGNGTASNESVIFISDLIKEFKLNLNYSVISEDGASIYSASSIASEEFPNLSVEKRSAISIARRIIDPLSELIKIDPKSIGVGQYQHDINKNILQQKVDFCIDYCVNQVGVDVNTASIPLLSKVSGLNKRSAKKIFEYVKKHQFIENREQLKTIPYITDKVFEQAAGFLRINNANNFLDRTSIHPEAYLVVNELCKYLQLPINKLINNYQVLNQLNPNELTTILKTDIYTIENIINNLKNPLQDVRDDYDIPILRSQMVDINNLKIGMLVQGTIRNQTEFGSFIDIGLKNDALLHISNYCEEDNLHVNKNINVYIDKIDTITQKISLKLKL